MHAAGEIIGSTTRRLSSVVSWSFKTYLVNTLNFFAYSIFLGYVLYQGFKTVRDIARPHDRTGLVTIHPELFDENGNIAEKELLVVRFKGIKPLLP